MKLFHRLTFYLLQIRFNEENFPFTTLYTEYTGIEIDTNEEISPYLCSKCETLLIVAFNFRKAIKESNEFLEHIYQKIRAYEDTVNGVIPNDERGRKVEELKRKIFSNNYCRFCYMESTFLNLLDSPAAKHKDESLLTIFTAVAKFSITQSELSFCICKSCMNQMIQIYDGCVTAQKNYSYVKKSLQQAQKAMQEGTLKIERYQVSNVGNKFPDDKAESSQATVSVVEPEFIKLESIEPFDAAGIEIKEENDDDDFGNDLEVPKEINIDPMSLIGEDNVLFEGDVEMITD